MEIPIHQSRLQQLEAQHADEETLRDMRRSEILATEMNKLEQGYFLSLNVIGANSAIALAVL